MYICMYVCIYVSMYHYVCVAAHCEAEMACSVAHYYPEARSLVNISLISPGHREKLSSDVVILSMVVMENGSGNCRKIS